MPQKEVSRSVNDEVRIRWTGSARWNTSQATWAANYARAFREEYGADRAARTGLPRGVAHSGGILHRHQIGHVYFTPSGVIIVRIHGMTEVGS